MKPRFERRDTASGSEYSFVFRDDIGTWMLPPGSSIIDCAYALDAEIGDHCSAAAVNGERVSLDTVLKARDRVVIATSQTAKPRTEWLGFAKSPARELIASALGLPLSDKDVATFVEHTGLDADELTRRIPKEAKFALTGAMPKAYAQPGRAGKKLIGAYVDEEDAKRLKSLLALQGTTVQDFFSDYVARTLAAAAPSPAQPASADKVRRHQSAPRAPK